MSHARVLCAGRVVTCDPARATPDDPLGTIDDGAVLVVDGRVAAVGERAQVLAAAPAVVIVDEAAGGLLTPGLVDAHTHAPFVGSRHEEYALRMSGAGYEAIAAAGGGIVASMRAVRSATQEELEATLASRLERMARCGVTTVEAKSGYGLDLASERRQLLAVAHVERADRPRLVATYLALHALPPEAGGDRDAFAARVLAHDLPSIAAEGLAKFVDAYVDRNAFSVAQARPVLARARELGLGVRLHVGQFADVGGAELAAELGAASADHLENVGEAGAMALGKAGVRACLLPVASFTLGQAAPPVALLRAAGVTMVVASDANPGTAPTESLPLALAFAVRLYGLTVSEAILGATREAAASLGLTDVGLLAPGARADVVMWDLPHEACLVQPFGTTRALQVFRDGSPL